MRPKGDRVAPAAFVWRPQLILQGLFSSDEAKFPKTDIHVTDMDIIVIMEIAGVRKEVTGPDRARKKGPKSRKAPRPP